MNESIQLSLRTPPRTMMFNGKAKLSGLSIILPKSYSLGELEVIRKGIMNKVYGRDQSEAIMVDPEGEYHYISGLTLVCQAPRLVIPADMNVQLVQLIG